MTVRFKKGRARSPVCYPSARAISITLTIKLKSTIINISYRPLFCLRKGDSMEVSVQLEVNATKEAVWSVISDIEHSAENIRGIESIEVLEKPAHGLVGLKWREKRIMFGKEAYETMWITEAEENSHYQTRAESHGAVYISRLSVEDKDGGCILTMGFKGEAQTLGAKISDVIFSGMMKKSTEKALYEDLEDIKKVAEAR